MGRRTLPAAQRWDDIIKAGRTSRPRRRIPHGWGRWLAFAVMFVGIIALLALTVFVYAELKIKANKERIGGLTREANGKPLNVLVLGSDSRGDLSRTDQQKFDPTGVDRKTGRRADTIMLVHIDPKREKAVLLHFPRDLRVKGPDGRLAKINGLYQKGSTALVKTVSDLTGLKINHFIEVNFAGFNHIVDTLGGVKVYFERPINDRDSGLHVPKGCVDLQGDQALAFVRVRKIDSDFERIARQQLFVRLLMEKMGSKGILLNPLKVISLVNSFSKDLTTDADLGLGTMKTLALRLRKLDSSRVDMRVVPSSPATIRGVSYVIKNENQSGALFAALREGTTLPDYGRTGVSPIDPGDVTIQVLNGTTNQGIAKKEAVLLRSKGFHVSVTANADNDAYQKNVVYFKEGAEQKAALVAELYNAVVKSVPKTIIMGTDDIALVLGRDYLQPPPPSPSPVSKSSGKNVAGAPKPLAHAC